MLRHHPADAYHRFTAAAATRLFGDDIEGSAADWRALPKALTPTQLDALFAAVKKRMDAHRQHRVCLVCDRRLPSSDGATIRLERLPLDAMGERLLAPADGSLPPSLVECC